MKPSPALCALALCAVAPACKRSGPAVPAPVGDLGMRGSGADLVGVRGETLRVWGSLAVAGLEVRHYRADTVTVTRASSAMYGGGRAGRHPDVLVAGGDDYSELAIPRDAKPGTYTGTLGDKAVTLVVSPVVLPAVLPRVWAYYDPRELGGTTQAPSAAERGCIAMFRERGVLLSPDLPVDAWPARQELIDTPWVPAWIANADDARAWIAALAGTGKTAFAIPIDEPRTAEARANVRSLSTTIPDGFTYAVTAEPHAELGDAIDLYITLRAKRDDAFPRWTYNGAPPRAGSMVVDALPPGPRTWGWIAHRWRIPVWYVWDALYWHDRHNKRGALDITRDATSFDNGADHGNLDGVLALPGDAATPCLPTLRLASLQRGQQDRALIERAAACDAAATDALVARMVPRALGDAPAGGAPSWPLDDASWERARRELIAIAERCGN